jgi:hypothetical protein
MRVELFICDPRVDEVIHRLNKLERSIMGLQQDMTQLISDFDAETTAVSARIDALELQVGSPVTADQVTQLQAISARLKVLGSDPNQPIPPATP